MYTYEHPIRLHIHAQWGLSNNRLGEVVREDNNAQPDSIVLSQ
jgi:hypothetical protein